MRTDEVSLAEPPPAREVRHGPPCWIGEAADVACDVDGMLRLLPRVREPVHLVRSDGTKPLGLALGGQIASRPKAVEGPRLALSWVGTLPPLHPEWLGDADFLAAHQVRFPYVAGAMAGGVSSPGMVIALGRAGMLGLLGTAGLPLARIEAAIDEVQSGLLGAHAAWGANLLHAPEAALEDATVELYLRRGVPRVSASAFLGITPALVRYACTGLAARPDGSVSRRNQLIAKVSRPEVAELFLAPAPAGILERLVVSGQLTPVEAALAARVPLAEDLTVEADSGGHTDNRPLNVLLPLVQRLRDKAHLRHRYTAPIRVGAAGGLGTPAAVAGAFALGASYVVTGSINQCAVEAATSELVKQMLARAGAADVAMAPTADLFELGVKVQVLKRGTLFAPRAQRLYQLYSQFDSLDDLPATARCELESKVFRRPLADVWEEARHQWRLIDPREEERAEADPRHKMALVFRWYLANASRWARAGDADRQLDFQIWCGPAVGGFNAWAEGSFLSDPANRGVVQMALNLLEGAAVVTRAQQLRACGVLLPSEAFDFRPRPLC
jgi:PfaD family protein